MATTVVVQPLKSQPEANEQAELKIPRTQANFWFFVLWLIYWFDYVDRNAINAVFPALKQTYNLSDAELGMISSIVGLSVTLLSVPIAWLVDKWSRKYMIAIMVSFWSLCTWASGVTQSYSQLLLARLGVGAGESAYTPAGYALVTAWYPQKLRGTMVGIFNIAQPLASFTGVAIAGWIAVTWGWRSVFGILAVPGLVLALSMIFAPDYKPKKVEGGETKVVQARFMETLKYCFKSPTMLLMYLAQGTATVWAIGGFGTWAPTFFGRTFSLDMAQAGMVVLVIGIIAAFGPPLGGQLSDRLVKRTPNGRIWAAAICLVEATIGWTISLVGALLGAPLPFVAAFWAIGNVGMAAHWGMAITVQMELVPPHYRGLAQSFSGWINLPFYVLTAPIAGYISDQLGLTTSLLVILLVAMAASLIVYAIASRTYNRDIAKLKQMGEFALE